MKPLFVSKKSCALLSTITATFFFTPFCLAGTPTATSQSVLTAHDTPVTITLRGTSPDGQPLTFSIYTKPAHGTLGTLKTGWAAQAQVVYTPYPGYVGPDSFTFRVSELGIYSSLATVNITDGYTVSGRIADGSGMAVPNVQLRFRPVSGANLYATSKSDGTYWIALPPGWSGATACTTSTPVLTPSSYTYANVSGDFANQNYSTGGISTPITPTATSQSISTLQDTPVTITLSGSSPDSQPLSFSITGNPSHGTLGAVSLVSATKATVLYTPAGGYSGSDSFTFTVAENGVSSAAATVSITVTSSGTTNPPPPTDTGPDPSGMGSTDSTAVTPTRIWYVATTGNDSNAGTINAPFKTIQKAAGIVLPGEQIMIRGGTYDVSTYSASSGTIYFRYSGQAGKPIFVTAYPSETVNLTTSSSKPIFDFTTWWGHNTAGFGHYIFQRLRITGGRSGWMFYPPAVSWSAGQPVANLWVGQNHNIIIEDCESTGNGVVQSAIYCRNAGVRNMTVRRCNFHHSIETEGNIDIGEWADADPAHAVPASASHDLLFEDCLLHDEVNSQGNGIVTQPCVFNVYFRRCLAWNNGKYGFACKGSGNFHLDRCAAWGNPQTEMYCRGFGGDSGTYRPPAHNQFYLTNCIFVAPQNQTGGGAVTWRENTDVNAYNCTIVGLRNTSYGIDGGYAFMDGNDHAITSIVRLYNCIIDGAKDANAMWMCTGNGKTYPLYTGYQANTNLFYCLSSNQFRYQTYNWTSLGQWQSYWRVGAPGGDNATHGPMASNADANSVFGNPMFVRLVPTSTPLSLKWTANLFDAANNCDLRLQSGSPAIGRGTNLTGQGLPELMVDYFGNPRPTTGAWTIGAINP